MALAAARFRLGQGGSPFLGSLPILPTLLPATLSALFRLPITPRSPPSRPSPGSPGALLTAIAATRMPGPKVPLTPLQQTAPQPARPLEPATNGALLINIRIRSMLRWAHGRSCSRQVKSRRRSAYSSSEALLIYCYGRLPVEPKVVQLSPRSHSTPLFWLPPTSDNPTPPPPTYWYRSELSLTPVGSFSRRPHAG
jgi:hypothetical protein